MNDLKKEQIKQLIILLIVLVAVIVIALIVENFVLTDDEEEVTNNTTTSSDEDTEENNTSTIKTEYTINGLTKSEWEEQEVWTDEDIYNYVMELFGIGLTEDLEIDFDEIKEDFNSTDEYDEETLDDIEAYWDQIYSESSN